MSLVAVYDALKEAKVSDHKATAAIEALETNRDEQRLRRIEEQIRNTEDRVVELRADMDRQFGEVRAELVNMQGRINLLAWMVGVSITLSILTLTMVGAILLKLAS